MNRKIKISDSGDSAIYCSVGDTISTDINEVVYSLEEYILNSSLKGIIETVPSFNGVMVYYNPLILNREYLVAEINAFSEYSRADVSERSKKMIVVPTFYGKEYGPDIEIVAEKNNLSVDEVVRIHSSAIYRIFMLGFTPGFPYLGGMDRRISTPRKSEPRLKVNAGSVGIAGEQTGIYPISSPGGWQIIGRTPLRLFQPDNEPVFLLEPGLYLKFKPVGFDEYIDIHRAVNSGSYQPEQISFTI